MWFSLDLKMTNDRYIKYLLSSYLGNFKVYPFPWSESYACSSIGKSTGAPCCGYVKYITRLLPISKIHIILIVNKYRPF